MLRLPDKGIPEDCHLRFCALYAVEYACLSSDPHSLARRQFMKNVEMSVSGNILTITVDLTKEFGPSSSGKTIIIASTEGNFRLPEREEVVGLNVYRKK